MRNRQAKVFIEGSFCFLWTEHDLSITDGTSRAVNANGDPEQGDRLTPRRLVRMRSAQVGVRNNIAIGIAWWQTA